MTDLVHDLKMRIAASPQFTPTEKLFLQEAVNAAAHGNGVIEHGNATWKTIAAEKVFKSE